MKRISGLKIRTTTYKESKAYQSFYSYTLSNTPFYFKLLWDANVSEEYKSKFSNNNVLWNFGDGEYQTGPEAEHYYKWPGVYSVEAKIYDKDGEVYSVFSDNLLTVFNAIPDIVTIGGLNNFGVLYPLDSGKKSPPLDIIRYNSWQFDNKLKDNNYTVNLYASGSNSSYVSVSSYYSSQWSHLKTYFGFIERTITVDDVLTEKLVNSTVTDSVSVYAKKINTGNFNGIWDVRLSFSNNPEPGTVFCGTSGSIPVDKTLHFIDQSPSNIESSSIILLYASIDSRIFNQGELNKINYKQENPYGIVNTVYSTQLVKSIFNSASGLNISSNGITVEGNVDPGTLSAQKLYSFDIYPIKFTNTKIPFVVTMKDLLGFTTKCYPMLKIKTDSEPIKKYEVDCSLIKVFKDGKTQKIDSAKFYTNSAVPVFEESGSYAAGILECDEPVDSVALSARCLIQDLPKNIPSKGYCFLMQPGINQLRRIRRLPKYGYFKSDNFEVAITSERETFGVPISGGVNVTYVPGYLANPLSGSFVWLTNSSSDFIFIVDEDGQRVGQDVNLQRLRVLSKNKDGTSTVRTVNIRKETLNNSAAPSNIAVNSAGDGWVTLYDCVTSFKLDKITGIAKNYVVPPVKNVFYNNLTYSSLLTSTSGFAGENLVLPTSIDVDKNNNVFISYTHPLCSFICKYSDDGNFISSIPFPFPYTVKNILIDGENNLWATTFNNTPVDYIDNPQTQNIVDRVDNLYYINFDDRDKSFSMEFSFLGSITMDSGGNVWVSSENNKITKVTPSQERLDFIIGSPQSSTDYVQDFGGFGGDLDGNLLIVNNSNGVLNYFNTLDPKQTDEEDIPNIVLQGIDNIFLEYNSRSYYNTIGDIAGVRWYLKNKVKENTTNRFIYGQSTLFNINKYTPIIVKKNENYDLATTLRSYVLQEPLHNNDNLFNNFFKPLLVGSTDSVNEIGKVIYEKISNFTDNVGDIDKCNIKSLNSYYEMFGESVETFVNVIPPNLLRTLDILSIKKCLLFGNINNFCNYFVLSTFEYSPASNLGRALNIETDYLIPGKPVISYDYFTKKYRLITNTLVPEINMVPFHPYPLSAIKYDWGWGLVLGTKSDTFKEIQNYYKFFNFIPTKNTDLYDGLIDFNDELTTYNYQLSTIYDWTKFGGGMEQILTSSIYKNLNLFNK